MHGRGSRERKRCLLCTVEDLERERDFYFAKLRDIERAVLLNIPLLILFAPEVRSPLMTASTGCFGPDAEYQGRVYLAIACSRA